MTSKHTEETIEAPAEMIPVRYAARGQHGMIEASEPVYLHAESAGDETDLSTAVRRAERYVPAGEWAASIDARVAYVVDGERAHRIAPVRATAFESQMRATKRLVALIEEGLGDEAEADSLRDDMDATWNSLSQREQTALTRYVVSLRGGGVE